MTVYGTQIGFTVEGLGVTGTDRLRYFSSGPAPSWDSDGAWVYCMPFTRWPGQLASKVSFRDGSCTVGGMSFEATASRTGADGRTVAQMLYDLTPIRIANIESHTAFDATTINTDNQTLAGQTIAVGATRECIQLGTHSGSGTYINCLRGRWGTRAQTIPVGTIGETGVFDALTGPMMQARRIQYWRCNMSTATSYSDVEVLWTGVVVSIVRPAPGLIQIDANSLLDLLRDRKILTRPWQCSVTTRETVGVAASPGDPAALPGQLWTVVGLDDRAPRSNPALISLDGKAVVSVTLTQTNSAGPYRGTFTRDHLYEVGEGQGRIPDGTQIRGWECHHLKGTTDTALPYSRNLAVLFEQAVLSSREGNCGDNDLGGDSDGDEDLGLAVDDGLVDIAGIRRVGARLGDYLDRVRGFWNFEKPDGVKVFNFFQAVLWPMGIVVCQKSDKVGWALLDDNDQFITTTLTETSDIPGPSSDPVRAPPAHERVMDLAFDSVRAEYGFLPGGGVVSDTFVDGRRRQSHPYADQSAPLANLHGVADERTVADILSALIQRFHDDLGRARFMVRRTSATAFDAGDLVLITHSAIPNSAGGAKGVTSAAFLVESKEDDASTNTSAVVALDVGSLYDSPRRIAPAMVVAGYTSGADVTMELIRPDGFQSGELSGVGASDVADLVVGDVYDHCDPSGAVIEQGFVFVGEGSGVVSWSKTPGTTPQVGDVFRVTDYDGATTRQKGRYAALADSNGQLGSGNDDGHQYTAY